MASDFGTIMDALVTLAEAESFTAERALKSADEINAEDFPYQCFFNPEETAPRGDFKLTEKTTTIGSILLTKGETQEATALKMDAFRDGVDTDPTLGGVVQMAHIATRSLWELGGTERDPTIKAGIMTIEVIEQTGRIISAVIDVDVELTANYVSWSTLDSTINTFVDSHLSGSRASSNLRRDLSALAEGAWLYSIAWVPTAYNEISSNDSSYDVSIRIGVYYRIAAATSETTILYGSMIGFVDGLLVPASWSALTGIHEVKNDTPTLALDDLERVE